MQVLWDLEAGFLKEIMDAIPEPKPSQSTVSTVLRILESKGFIDHKAYGKSFQYFPLLGKEEYAGKYMDNFVRNYFGGSFRKMLSHFIREKDVDLDVLNALLAENEEGDEHGS